MRLCSIASGSSGNCVYVGSEATHLLVDVGISGKRTEAGLNGLGLCMRDIDGILITHEHSDHIAGLNVLSKKYEVPIYTTQGTMNAILNTRNCCVPKELFHVINADEKLIIKDVTCNPMRISHDAAEPVAYRFQYGRRRIAVVTDLGTYNDYTIECLKGMDALMLEANHDVNMLQVGPYPYYLKQRILGDRGHLSNEKAGQLLSALLHDHLQTVVLGHLSKENNLPELAYEAVRVEVTMEKHKCDIPLVVAKRSEPTQVIHIA